MQQIVYYLTRDTNCSGELSSSVDLWYRKPTRCKLTFERGYVWMPSNGPEKDLGLYGSYTLEQVRAWFKTIPDTDLELIRCETQQEQQP